MGVTGEEEAGSPWTTVAESSIAARARVEGEETQVLERPFVGLIACVLWLVCDGRRNPCEEREEDDSLGDVVVGE